MSFNKNGHTSIFSPPSATCIYIYVLYSVEVYIYVGSTNTFLHLVTVVVSCAFFYFDCIYSPCNNSNCAFVYSILQCSIFVPKSFMCLSDSFKVLHTNCQYQLLKWNVNLLKLIQLSSDVLKIALKCCCSKSMKLEQIILHKHVTLFNCVLIAF